MSHPQPSSYLPPLHPLPHPPSLSHPISLLSSFLTSTSNLVDLRPPIASYNALIVEAEQEADEFEVGFAQGWLERVVALAGRVLARGEGEGWQGEWEAVVEDAARVLAGSLGPSAQGSLTKTYLLPRPTGHLDNPQRTSSFAYPTPPPTRPASTVPFERFSPPPHSAIPPADISLTVRDGTLVEASTGHRTWGAASLFSHRLASSSSSYLPFAPSNRSLRVLELGSGTGLVGLAAAKVLEALDVPARVVLSDGGDEPDTVLANLRENVEANFPPADSAASCVKVTSERLDWRDYLPSSPSIRAVSHMRQERYDLLLGTDLAYERGQATLLHAAVAVLLRFPSSAPSRDEPNPVFWLTVALRPTHTAEIAEVDSLFPSSSISSSVNPALLRTHDGKLYRLVSTATEDVVGPDGFAGRAVRGKMGARGEMRYRIYRVEWEEMRG